MNRTGWNPPPGVWLDSDIENIVVGVHPVLDELDDGKDQIDVSKLQLNT